MLASPFGRTLVAIRENERRARFLGIPIERHIWLSFSISCCFTALAGSLYALLNNFADPMGLHYSLSGEIVIMTVMGGMRSFWGPLVGAALFVVLQDYISSMTVNWMSFVGLISFWSCCSSHGVCWVCCKKESGDEHARYSERNETVWQPGCGGCGIDAGGGGGTARHHRA